MPLNTRAKPIIFCIVDLVCHHWYLILFYLYFWTDLLSNPCCFDPQWHQARYDCKFLGGQKLYSATVEIDNLSIQDAANRGPFSLWSRETLMEKKHAVDALRFIRSLFEFWISHSFLWHVYVNLPNQIFMGIFSRRVTFWLVFAIGTMWELKARVGSGSFLDLLDFIMPDIEVEKYW